MDIQKAIQEELQKIQRTEGVRVLHAAESGSRAWGFASPDSDYDVRFVYVRPLKDYLSIRQNRDVIEWQLDDVLDINGWDLLKTLRLLYNGNPTAFEWGFSPIVYRTTPEWAEVMDAGRAYFSVKSAVRHYNGTAMNTYYRHLTGDTVRYKKYFYALRPLLASLYIEKNQTIPPVLFSDLIQMDMDGDLRAAIDVLLERKKATTEGEYLPHIPQVLGFIKDELARQKAVSAALPDSEPLDAGPLDACFQRIVGLTE